MQIIRNAEATTLTFVPMEPGEAEVLNQIVAIAKPEDKMVYGGRSGGDEGESPFTVYLHIGSRREQKVKKEGNITSRWTEEVGGVKLGLHGTDEESDNEVCRIRNTCYFGSGGLIFLGKTEVDGRIAIITTAKRCKHCGAGMIDFGRCEWNTCEACVAKCEHHYVRGMVLGGSAGGLGMGEYCDKCGRGKPEPEGVRQKGKVERELEVQRETGMAILYKEDGPIKTPQQAVTAGRLLRRYRKAKARG